MSEDASHVERLRGVLGTPDTAWLLNRLRSRLEQKGSLTGTVSKRSASTAERIAVSRLFGNPVRTGSSATVSLEMLDAKLRRGAWPDGLESAVVALTGPVIGPDERRAEREAWDEASHVLRQVTGIHLQLADWVEQAERWGTLKRAVRSPAEASRLAGQLVMLAKALPAEGEVLGVLAARLFGDAHALDPKTTLGALAAGLAAALGERPSPSSAHDRREAWLACGVVVDDLSSTVIALGLPGGDSSPTARALAALSDSGQPAVLTYRQLAVDDIGVCPGVVWVCENPAVIASAADRFRGSAPALVCVNGQPGAAVVRLLSRLIEGGSRLRYHGDFDAGGVSIARTLARRVPWSPWRFDEKHYRAACAGGESFSSFTGMVGETPWDPGLSAAMQEFRLRVEEESVLQELLEDLEER
ncbi:MULTISPECIES: TIGR02679 family protein [unclassified Leifsonia]|uniref:TIGR02679 family protein n=1 Tax=unclassified Leifsonia TaxID=2663824 RepID=UPI0008A80220|nr:MULTISPECIES: TIGR02679 family protein [unclassified Leifsonia]SEI10190.1 TIGR02679 family protein [Leifsonia sp. CL154]SFL86509.1 TIGR02679 family protein [Leifsonia sp. CL147]